MAASTKKRPRRYHTPGVVSGNLARELNHQELERRLETSGQLDFDQQYRRRKETEAELIARQRARAKAALEQVGLGSKLYNKPNQLSGGQQQRVSIARALVHDPAVLLADEPTGALDSHTSREVLGLLQDLHRQGHTVVLITHDNSIAVQAERIIRLEDGRVVYDGDAHAPDAVVQPGAQFGQSEREVRS